MNSSGTSIGDIKTTTRTDMGDDWLLCNGADISPDDYPELCQYLVKTEAQWVSKQLSSTLNITVKDALYYNNMYYVVGFIDNASTLYLLTTTNLNESWTISQYNFSSVFSSRAHLMVMNGSVKVFAGTVPGASYVFTVSSDKLPSTYDATYNSAAVNFSYLNNKLISPMSTSYAVLSNDFSSVTEYTFPVGSDEHEFYCGSRHICYVNGTYAIAGRSYGDTSSTWIASTKNDPSSNNWTITELGKYGIAKCISYYNGMYIFTSKENSTTKPVYIWSSTNLTSGWTRSVLTSSNLDVGSINYVNGKYYIYGCISNAPVICTNTELHNNAWLVETISTTQMSLGTSQSYAIVTEKENIAIIGTVSSYPVAYIKSAPGYQLPTITSDLSYAYIKAR